MVFTLASPTSTAFLVLTVVFVLISSFKYSAYSALQYAFIPFVVIVNLLPAQYNVDFVFLKDLLKVTL